MSERDIYEVANQLGGYVSSATPKHLAAFLLREADEASKLADAIAALRRENQELRADCQRKDELLTAAVDDYNEARSLAIEECAKVAERDADWSAFGKAGFEPWENGPDSVRDYRIGISSGRAIAASIRALTMSDIHREQTDGKETT